MPTEPLTEDTWFDTLVLRNLHGRRNYELAPRVILDIVDRTGIWLCVLPLRVVVLVRLEQDADVRGTDRLRFAFRTSTTSHATFRAVPIPSRTTNEVLHLITTAAVQMVDAAAAHNPEVLVAG